MDYKKEQLFRMQQDYDSRKMPFYMTYPVQNMYMTEIEYERDMEKMKELYPKEAKDIQKLVENECDRMEYDGSLMFDEYPDRLMLRRVCNAIYEKLIANADTDTEMPEMPEENMSAMQMRGNYPYGPGPAMPPRGPVPLPPPRNDGLMNLIEVLLYNEMYKRRCRNRRCHRWW